MSQGSIIIADSQFLIRVGLRNIIAKHPKFHVAAEATDEENLMELVRIHSPNMVTIDYNQPKNFSLDIIERLKKESPKTRLIIISGDDDRKNIFQVLEGGVHSFLSKQCDEKEIVDAIVATSNGEKFYCTNVLNYLLEKSFPKQDCSPTPLSPREIEVVQLVASGLIAKEIAAQLNLSTHTIYTHRKNIMKKLKIGSTSELVLYAVREGWVSQN